MSAARRLALALGVLLAASALGSADGRAQGLGGLGGGEGSLDIRAEEGIEWRRDTQVYIARGNAQAVRGDLSLRADRLVAHYRESAGGGGSTEIHRVEAVGEVRVETPTETARGDRGVFDLDRDVVVLTGADLRLETGEERITARDSLEYWAARNLAVARGNAVAVRGERRIRARVMTAHFAAGAGGADTGAAGGVRRIEAFEEVEIASPDSVARADKAVYNTRTRIATLLGAVRLTQGQSQLNGGYAEINLNTGVSRLLGAPPDAEAKRRVRGLIAPGKDDLKAPAPDDDTDGAAGGDGGS